MEKPINMTDAQFEEQNEIRRIMQKRDPLTEEEQRKLEAFRRESSMWDPRPEWGDGKHVLMICEICSCNLRRNGRLIDCGMIDDGETPITPDEFLQYSEGNCPWFLEDLAKKQECEEFVRSGKAKWGEWKKAGK